MQRKLVLGKLARDVLLLQYELNYWSRNKRLLESERSAADAELK